MALDLYPDGDDGRRSAPQRRGRWLTAGPRWLWRRSREAAAADEIASNARLIRRLTVALRRPAAQDQPLVATEDGRLDAEATATEMGISRRELERRWQARRRQTAHLAWGCFLAGWSFLGLWAWQMMALHGAADRWWAAMQVLPFCAVFFVLAFRGAWQNWQLRTRRLGSAADYLRTTEPFWPSAG